MLLGFYALVWAGVVNGSWLTDLDLAILRAEPTTAWPELHPLVSVLVLLGQRAICLAALVLWLGARYLRDRDPRPLLWAAVATLLLNIVVGAAKMIGDRLGPLQLGDRAVAPGAAEVFTVGMAFPSGHSANAVLMWGVLVHVARRFRRLGAAVIVVLALVVGSATLYLGTHWITDVWAGWALGAAVLLVVPDLRPVVDRLERWLTAATHRLGRRRPLPSAPSPTVPAVASTGDRALRVGQAPDQERGTATALPEAHPVPPGTHRRQAA